MGQRSWNRFRQPRAARIDLRTLAKYFWQAAQDLPCYRAWIVSCCWDFSEFERTEHGGRGELGGGGPHLESPPPGGGARGCVSPRPFPLRPHFRGPGGG